MHKRDVVVAQRGDTFCSIAVQHGFRNCTPLREHDGNKAIAGRQLQPGDEVFVPPVKTSSSPAPTDTRSTFTRSGLPLAEIRFVRESGGLLKDDETLHHLEVSNYRTTKAGVDGTAEFAPPEMWLFNPQSRADPDAFKLEVRDQWASDRTLEVILRAMKPEYGPHGGPVAHKIWTDPNGIEDNTRLTYVTAYDTGQDHRFRSGYLRLVVDEADSQARRQQTLLVTDDYPRDKRIEILDQTVRAEYLLSICKQPQISRCRVLSKELEVGDKKTKKRFKICVGVFRQNGGDPVGIHGVTTEDMERLVYKWLRRVYAQANMAPKVVAPGIRYLDPPPPNMLCVSNIDGCCTTEPAEMQVAIESTQRQGAPKSEPPLVLRIKDLAVSPKDVADRLADLIKAEGYTVDVYENPPVLGAPPVQRSADLLIRGKQGGTIRVTSVRGPTGWNATLSMVRIGTITNRPDSQGVINVDLNNFWMHEEGEENLGSIHARYIMRNYGGRDRINVYVIGRFFSGDKMGEAFNPWYELPEPYRPDPPTPFSVFLAAVEDYDPNDKSLPPRDPADFNKPVVLIGSGNPNPYTLPHECGHVLLDCHHARSPAELMREGGTSMASESGSKRLCDRPLEVEYEFYDSAFGAAAHPKDKEFLKVIPDFAVPRLQAHSTTKAKAIFEPW
jgi:hypothetical protein